MGHTIVPPLRYFPAAIMFLAFLTVSTPGKSAADGYPERFSLMPAPESLTPGTGGLRLDSTFTAVLTEYRDFRLERACRRLEERVIRHTGLIVTPSSATPAGQCRLRVAVAAAAGIYPQLGDDESYRLEVTSDGALLSAASPYGALRGMETFLQLIEPGPDGFRVRSATITDRPRFPWRGLLIDVCRHWLPLPDLKRVLDAMAAVKLNVLHWHISEDQGFRAESRRYPRLHGLGSDGLFYTQEEMREVVAYAADRGIRVVPEFDMPGHTTAWFVGHPELASAPGPYTIERTWGIKDPSMDPSRDEVYAFLDTLIGEMAALFPDRFFHIGGDEVTGKHWDGNPEIQRFREQRGLKDNHDLQVHFNRRVLDILRQYGKIMVGWDEILHTDLPKEVVVQSWRGQKSLAAAAAAGYRGILSHGYYLDQMQPAADHYAVDPLGGDAAGLAPGEAARVLGGEACMWAEFVTPENIDSRLWPRAAVVAERLWSPPTVTDVPDMQRRLAAAGRWLEREGALHRRQVRLMIERLAGGGPVEPLLLLSEAVEPLKLYSRHRLRQFTSFTPMNRLADAIPPESESAGRLAARIEELMRDPARKRNATEIGTLLLEWQRNHELILGTLSTVGQPEEIEQVSLLVRDLSALGLRALKTFVARSPFSLTEAEEAILRRAGQPVAEVSIAILPSVRSLAAAAEGGPGR